MAATQQLTMAFFTRCCKSAAKACLWLALFAFYFGAAHAQEIQNRHFQMELNEDGWVMSADFGINLTPVLEEALKRGLSLPFVVETNVQRERWYWFDKPVTQAELTLRLSFTPLTQQYRVSRGEGGLALRFEHLEDALRALGQVRNWRIGPAELLKRREVYSVTTRLRLDTAELPKPFQLNAITNREWTLESAWKTLQLKP